MSDEAIIRADTDYVLRWLRQIEAPANIIGLQERALAALGRLTAERPELCGCLEQSVHCHKEAGDVMDAVCARDFFASAGVSGGTPPSEPEVEADQTAGAPSGSLDGGAELAAAVARAEAAERGLAEAQRWLEEHFSNEDDDEFADWPLLDLVKRVYEWGDSAWDVAGKELERTQLAQARVGRLEEALRALLDNHGGTGTVAIQRWYHAEQAAREALAGVETRRQDEAG